MKVQKFSIVFLIVSSILLFASIFFFTDSGQYKASEKTAQPAITAEKTDGILRVLLFHHSSDYFIYKGTPIGFQYELLSELADHLGKKIDFDIQSDADRVYSAAFSNQYDIVAMDFKKNIWTAELLELSTPHSFSYPVIIKRIEEEADYVPQKILYVPYQFPTQITKDSLRDPGTWKIAYASSSTNEEMFELLRKKKMDYIVSDHHTAITLLPFYSDLMIERKIGPSFERTWTLNSNNTVLNDSINRWLTSFMKSPKYKTLCKKYFSQYSKVLNYSLSKEKSYTISPYDKIIREYAKKHGLDWRLVSSIIYQESGFQPGLTGMGGSFGLMQLMPATGRAYGINSNSSDEEQIKAGIRHLADLKRMYKSIKDPEDHLKFICATYNAGSGHIKDAQKLCQKYGEDHTVWENVAKYLILKSESQYFNDSIVKCGYYPGNHTVKYVNQVYSRYEAYKATVK